MVKSISGREVEMRGEAMNKDIDIKKILEAYLKAIFPEREELFLAKAEKMRLGGSHIIFMLTADWKDGNERVSKGLVVRMEPDMGVHQSYDIGRECEAVKKMHAGGVPVPKIYWLEEDSKVLGHPFLLMEKIEGERLLEVWIRQPEYRLQLMEDLISVLAKIHNVNWQAHGLSFLGEPEHKLFYVEKEIKKWERVLENNQYSAYPVMMEVAAWLRTNAHPSERTTVCHGDYSVLNAHVYEGRIAAILDWEMIGLGDPVSDVAWLCMMAQSMRIPDWDEARFVRGYEEMTGTKVGEECLAFWKIFSGFKMVAIAVSGLRALIESKDPSMREMFNFSMLIVALQDVVAKSVGF
jgi:aminoglycoside phosphotransferase (APT) family kinase protein